MGATLYKDSSNTNIKRDTIYHFGDIDILTDPFRNCQYFKQKYDFVLGPEVHSGEIDMLKK